MAFALAVISANSKLVLWVLLLSDSALRQQKNVIRDKCYCELSVRDPSVFSKFHFVLFMSLGELQLWK